MNQIHAVTGASGYTGKYITRRLLAQGAQVISLTNHPQRMDEFGRRVATLPYNFDQPEKLMSHLHGVDVLYNTYWVRFNYGKITYAQAVQNSLILFQAAQAAGVRRIVHVSITNPSLDSPLPYFRGKAELEQALETSGLSYAILRPTVLFGLEDILINNIAYLLRTFPVFVIPGHGDYRLQPVYVEDFADLAVQAGSQTENMVVDAVGPDIFTFNELVRLVAAQIGRRPWVVHLPERAALALASLVGWWYRDVTLTSDEQRGLSQNLLVSDQPPRGRTRLGDWLAEHAGQIGQRYASELERHYRLGGG